MPRMSQLEWWLQKEPDILKATELWKQHQQSIANKRAQNVKEKFESISKWGDWEVLQPITYKQEKMPAGKIRNLVKVRCKCGTEDFIDRANLMSGRSTACRGCYHRGSLNNRWSGYKSMPGTVFHRIKSGWKHRKTREKRNLSFTITKRDIYNKFVEQNGKCAYTGIQLDWNTASVDRINPQIGYEVGNIQWVYNKINFMKWELTHDEFIKYAKLIVEKYS